MSSIDNLFAAEGQLPPPPSFQLSISMNGEEEEEGSALLSNSNVQNDKDGVVNSKKNKKKRRKKGPQQPLQQQPPQQQQQQQQQRTQASTAIASANNNPSSIGSKASTKRAQGSVLSSATTTTSSGDIWKETEPQDWDRIEEFWLTLTEAERRDLVRLEKEAVLKKMREQQKNTCQCSVCERRRTVIEEELEMMYDVYYADLESYVEEHGHGRLPTAIASAHINGQDTTHHANAFFISSLNEQSSAKSNGNNHHGPLRHPKETRGSAFLAPFGLSLHDASAMLGSFDVNETVMNYHNDENDDDDDGDDESLNEDPDDDANDNDADEMLSDHHHHDHIPRTASQPILGTSAFAAPRSAAKFSPATHPPIPLPSGPASRSSVRGGVLTLADDLLRNDGKKFLEIMERLADRRMRREEDQEDTEYDYDPSDEAEQDSYEDADSVQEESMSEEERMEEGRQMFLMFAAKMFEQRVLVAYREKMAEVKQRQLIEEEEAEERANRERQLKRQNKRDKKKQQKQLQKEDQNKASEPSVATQQVQLLADSNDDDNDVGSDAEDEIIARLARTKLAPSKLDNRIVKTEPLPKPIVADKSDKASNKSDKDVNDDKRQPIRPKATAPPKVASAAPTQKPASHQPSKAPVAKPAPRTSSVSAQQTSTRSSTLPQASVTVTKQVVGSQADKTNGHKVSTTASTSQSDVTHSTARPPSKPQNTTTTGQANGNRAPSAWAIPSNAASTSSVVRPPPAATVNGSAPTHSGRAWGIEPVKTPTLPTTTVKFDSAPSSTLSQNRPNDQQAAQMLTANTLFSDRDALMPFSTNKSMPNGLTGIAPRTSAGGAVSQHQEPYDPASSFFINSLFPATSHASQGLRPLLTPPIVNLSSVFTPTLHDQELLANKAFSLWPS